MVCLVVDQMAFPYPVTDIFQQYIPKRGHFCSSDSTWTMQTIYIFSKMSRDSPTATCKIIWFCSMRKHIFGIVTFIFFSYFFGFVISRRKIVERSMFLSRTGVYDLIFTTKVMHIFHQTDQMFNVTTRLNLMIQLKKKKLKNQVICLHVHYIHWHLSGIDRIKAVVFCIASLSNKTQRVPSLTIMAGIQSL